MKLSKEIKAGAIALLAIIGFIVLFQFMKGNNLFTTDNVFYAKYDNVEGLEASSPVSINGLRVGQIDEIIPITDKNGKIHFVVKASVSDDFQFSKKSTMEIFEPGLMSGKAMRINLAYGGALAKDGDTLQSNYKLSMMNSLSSQVGPVKDQLTVVLKRMDSLMMSTNEVMDERNRAEIRALLSNLNRTVSSLEGTSRSANSLLANNDPRVQKMLENASLATMSARTTLDRYYRVADEIDVQQLNATIDKLDQTSAKLNNVVAGIQNGEGSLGKLAKDEELYHNLNRTARHLDSLVLDVKANPKRYVNFSVFGKNSSK